MFGKIFVFSHLQYGWCNPEWYHTGGEIKERENTAKMYTCQKISKHKNLLYTCQKISKHLYACQKISKQKHLLYACQKISKQKHLYACQKISKQKHLLYACQKISKQKHVLYACQKISKQKHLLYTCQKISKQTNLYTSQKILKQKNLLYACQKISKQTNLLYACQKTSSQKNPQFPSLCQLWQNSGTYLMACASLNMVLMINVVTIMIIMVLKGTIQGTNWTGIARAAQNRVRWRGVVDDLCSTRSDGHKYVKGTIQDFYNLLTALQTVSKWAGWNCMQITSNAWKLLRKPVWHFSL